jgi:hypothetical protein
MIIQLSHIPWLEWKKLVSQEQFGRILLRPHESQLSFYLQEKQSGKHSGILTYAYSNNVRLTQSIVLGIYISRILAVCLGCKLDIHSKKDKLYSNSNILLIIDTISFTYAIALRIAGFFKKVAIFA